MFTPEQEDELRRCESIIEKALTSTAAEKGAALRTIRDAGLYLRHGTFEAYCEDRWGMSRSYAYRHIDLASVTENLSPIGDIALTESQARHLSGLSPERQREAYLEAASTAPNGKITAAHIASVADRYRERSPSFSAEYGEDPEPWHVFEELVAVKEAVKEMAERWPKDKLEILANKLIWLGRELIDNGSIA